NKEQRYIFIGQVPQTPFPLRQGNPNPKQQVNEYFLNKIGNNNPRPKLIRITRIITEY
ncbi:unnamed protein product, partial [Linum tenue]